MAVEAILNFVVTFMDAILIFISKKETFRYCYSFFEFKLLCIHSDTDKAFNHILREELVLFVFYHVC